MKNEWLDRAAMKQEIESLRAQVQTLTAAQGGDALKVIDQLRANLETQREEFEKNLNEGFEEAYQMILAQRHENEKLEVTLYEEYDKKLKEVKEFIISQVDRYLNFKWQELHEAGDGSVALLEKWRAAVPSSYMVEEAIVSEITGEGKAITPSTPQFQKQNDEIEELKAQLKIMEARNMRLSVECEKLRANSVEATAREKETRKMAGLPDEPVMQDVMKAGLIGKLKKSVPDL